MGPRLTPTDVGRAVNVLGWTAVAAIGCWLVIQPYGLRWDFANFYDTGRRVLLGDGGLIYDATSPIAGRAPLGVMRFWGVPLAGVLYAPLAAIPPGMAMFALKAQNALAVILGMTILIRALGAGSPVGRLEGWQRGTLLLSLVLLFQPFWTVLLVGGQTTPTVFLCVSAMIALFARGRVWAPAWLLSVVLILKPAFVLLLVPFVIDRRRAFLLAAGCALGLLGLVSVLALGWRVHGEFLQRMLVGLGDDRLWQYNSGLSLLPLNLRLAWPAAAARLRLLGTLMRLGAGVWVLSLVWRSGRAWPDGADRRLYVAFMSVLFFLLASEILWEHYLIVLVVPAMFVLMRPGMFSRRAIGLMAASVVTCAGQNIGLTLLADRLVTIDTPGEALATAVWKTAPLLFLMAFLLLAHGELVSVIRLSRGPAGASGPGRRLEGPCL